MEKKNVNEGWELDGMPHWVVLILLSPSMFLFGKFFIVPCYDFIKEFDGFMEFIKFVLDIPLNYIPIWILLPVLILCLKCTINSIIFDTRK